VTGKGLGGITVVLPAYREEGNLATTVEDMLGTLAGCGERHWVVVVNDGSDDGTGSTADLLADRYPARVLVVHHPVNRGYGAAVRTGIATAIERTDSAWLFLTDSDGQFRATQLPWFLSQAREQHADAVIGYRPRRADPRSRKVNAWLWTQASRLLLGVGARDVDCAYKLINRRLLDGVELRGDAALISPELLMRIADRGARIVQLPVDHYPREHGQQTGAKLSVILASLAGLVGLWRERMGTALLNVAAEQVIVPIFPVD
jgi:glycosyltransferase involved in cell wall biosynthesis